MEELICREGTVHSVIFQNAENGYTVLRLLTEEGEVVTVVGCIPCVAPGEHLTVTGTWETHPQHGQQLKAEELERSLPEEEEEIFSYLSSGICRGVGPTTARHGIEIRPLFQGACVAAALRFRSDSAVGQQDGKIGEIIVQDEPGRLPIPLGKGVAQSAVHGLEPPQFRFRQGVCRRAHIPEHQKTRTMVKVSPPRAFTRRSYQMAMATPRAAPSTAMVYWAATLAFRARGIRYPARNSTTGSR